MQSTKALPAEPIESSAWRAALLAAGIAAVVAVVLFVVSGVAVALLPWSGQPHVAPPFTGHRWVQGWAQWDSGWYYRIAHDGYSYVKGRQSTVVFFPVYPLLMRATAGAVGNTYVAGILVTAAAGVASAALFFTWVRERLSPRAAKAALLLFVLYPYAFFMFGAVYADAVFILAVIGAFLLLEHDHPWLAGLVGALATASRPMGAVLVVGLAVRAWERRHTEGDADGDATAGAATTRWRWRDAGVLLSAGGLAAFSIYLWSRFGDPLAFLTGQEAWGQSAGLHTWLKIQFFKDVTNFSSPLSWLTFVAHPILTFAGLALVPRIFRRFGKGYAIYVLLLIGLSALSTKNFFGMSRYLLAAFPCFAVAGELVADRPALRRTATVASAAGLVALTAAFSRGYYLS
jgi:Gpi18-like mannosyltransferase